MSEVAKFYNSVPQREREARQQSPIFRLRKFNNWVKSVLIQRSQPESADETKRVTVLDIGCGKGGDLLKWKIKGCRAYVGLDIADISVDQAVERYEKMRKPFHARFYTADAFVESLPDLLKNMSFDIVSMQFVLHYAFENEEKVRCLLKNVAHCLKRGGLFIGTIPSSDALIERIKKLKPEETKWGNDLYEVRFDEPPPKEFIKPYGNKYSFFLKDAVDVPEYVVPFEILRGIAEDFNLELVYQENFHDLYRKEIKEPAYRDLFHRMVGVDQNGYREVQGDEWEASGLYLAFGFEKRGGVY